MTLQEFREMALALEGAEEREHMGHPDFRAGGRIFATLQPSKGMGMVKLPPGEQQTYLQLAPAAFTPAAGAWGRAGSTLVQLSLADAAIVREAMELAWREARSVKPKTAKAAAPRTTAAASRTSAAASRKQASASRANAPAPRAKAPASRAKPAPKRQDRKNVPRSSS
jgi:hypothetical protein